MAKRDFWLSEPTERWVPIPHAGMPPESERRPSRKVLIGLRPRERLDALVRGRTIEDWIGDLTGTSYASRYDLKWSLRAVRYLKQIIAVHEERVVRQAREWRWPWDQIAAYLGVSRQAVHKRWAKRMAEPPSQPMTIVPRA